MFAIFPEILHAVEKGDQEALACLVRKYFAGNDLFAPRLRVEDLLTSLGVTVTREKVPYYARLQVIDHRGQYRVTISVSQRVESLRELNFTLAHLLGQLLIHFMPQMAGAELSAEAYQLEASAAARLTQRSSQITATDHFALALLMPLGMVKKAHQTLKNEENCAQFFHVLPGLLHLRLSHLGFLAETPEPIPPAVAQPPVETSKPAKKSTSITRAQHAVASQGYRRQESTRTTQEPAVAEKKSGSGLKRLRELAKKIDRTVDT